MIFEFMFTTEEGKAVLMILSWLCGFFTMALLRPSRVSDKKKANIELVKAVRELADDMELSLAYMSDVSRAHMREDIKKYRAIADKYDQRIKESDCE